MFYGLWGDLRETSDEDRIHLGRSPSLVVPWKLQSERPLALAQTLQALCSLVSGKGNQQGQFQGFIVMSRSTELRLLAGDSPHFPYVRKLRIMVLQRDKCLSSLLGPGHNPREASAE